MLKGVGFTDEDLAQPLVGVATTWIETMPCNLNQRAARRLREAGHPRRRRHADRVQHDLGLRRRTMGTAGMRASLISREVIADSIELVARGHLFDGLVCIVGCDKTIPAAVMALARLDMPGPRVLQRLDRGRAGTAGRTSRSRTSSRRSARTPPAR